MEDVSLCFINRCAHNSGDYIALHSHSCVELVMYQTGSGSTVIGKKEYDFSRSTVAVIGKGVEHSERHKCGGSMIFFGANCGASFEKAGVCPSEGLYHPKNHSTIPFLFEQIYTEAKEQKYNYEVVISAKICELFVLLSREERSEASHKKSLDYSMNYICENFQNQIDINSLAESSGFGYEHFRHCFKKGFGISPVQAIIRQRLLYAKNLLETTNLSCTEIAMKCGFSDSSQFSRMFAAHFKVTPKRYGMRNGNSADGEK